MVAPLKDGRQSEKFLEATFSSLGKMERCCENKPRQAPLKVLPMSMNFTFLQAVFIDFI